MSENERKTACVTGGNGFIASALIKMLLEKGYAVNTTVRNPDDMKKNSHFKDLEALGPLKVFRADLDKEGSFDEAVNGCDYAFLVSAPKEMIEAGVQGTLNVIRSCAKAATVKRVILTSSASAIFGRPLQGDGHVLDEESWNELQLKNLKALAASGAVPIVHVDDLCRAEIFLVEKESASGRYICSSLSITVLNLARFVAGRYPEYNVQIDCFEGFPEKAKVCCSSEKLIREGFEYKCTNLDEIFDDLVEYGKALGILPH
uniref:3-beta hydroxysteroid dehydrogenase/isomerase domain-containing protein n=1 Tax=Leersia perrieri TaxID=77586 RepID=A0A0D9W9Y0_9ORYZ